MASSQDPTDPIRKMAVGFPATVQGSSCNQSSFKTAKGAFLFIGPGPKGKGFKAMFKLGASMAQAKKLAAKEPDRFEVGSTSWVTTRFTSEQPLPRSIWEKWLKESYAMTGASGTQKKKAAEKTVKKAAKKVTRKAAKKAGKRG